jgi:heme oxygenase
MHPPDIHSQLKIATAEIHARLERDLDLLRGDFSLQDYIHLLERFYGIYEPLERSAEPSLSRIAALQFHRRKKSAWLASDLDYLRGSQAFSSLPRLHMVAPEHIEQWLGCLYVLEGSMLGGQILARCFASRFQLAPGRGLSYFTGYGEETAAMWKSFLDVLAAYSRTEAAKQLMVASAVTMFQRLHGWLLDNSYQSDHSAA